MSYEEKIILNLLIIITLSILTGCNKSDESTSLMDYGDYKNVTKDNIKQIEIIKYTEAGSNTTLVDENSIIGVYNKLKKMKIGRKTDMACDDNTTIYVFTLTDETKLSLEIECDWVVIDNIRYILK